MGALFTFLGTGASSGVPLIGCECSVCSSSSPKNRRLRPSGWIQVNGKSFLIDAGPDFRQQALTHKIARVDGLLLTHMHFDHIAGIDDLRIFSVRSEKAIACLLSKESFRELQLRYHYFFKSGTSATARFDCQPFDQEVGMVLFERLPVRYFNYFQGEMKVTGYRIGDFAYITDIREYDEAIFDFLKGVKHLVLSALRKEPSHIHFCLDEAVRFAEKAGIASTRLTHVSHFVDHEKVNQELPSHVQLGFDGLQIEFEV